MHGNKASLYKWGTRKTRVHLYSMHLLSLAVCCPNVLNHTPVPPPCPPGLQLYPTKDTSSEAPPENEGAGASGSADPPSNDNSNTDTPLSERPAEEEDDEILLSESDDEESDNNDEDERFGDPTGDNSS